MVLLMPHYGYSQDLSKIDKKHPIKANGSVAAGAVLYNAQGIENRRDPFFWQFNANLNFNILGVAVPFSANFSQQERKFTQPFNQYGLSPTYKGITLHAGYRTITFSNFTLGGRVFLGGGLDVKPQGSLLNGTVLYGRFARAVQEGGNDGMVVGIAAYERWGYGARIGLGTEKDNVNLMFFRGKDDITSLNPEGLPADLKPQENLVWGITTRKSFTKVVSVDLEYAFSAFTNDISNQEVILENFSYYNNLGGVYTPNITSQFNRAFLGNINFQKEKYQFKISARHTDPEYQSMGTPFLNNDLQDLTGALSWRMFKEKVMISTSAGGQRNNLDNSQAARVVRFVSSAAIQYNVTDRLNFGLNYGNYNTSTSKVQYQIIDSIKYFQVTHNGGFVANYGFGKEKTRQNVIFNTTYQKATDSESNGSDVTNMVTTYSLTLSSIQLNIQTAGNYTISAFQTTETNAYGLSLTLAKPFWKKRINASVGANRQQTYTDGEALNYTTNLTSTLRYNFLKKHGLALSGVTLWRKNLNGRYPSFSEQRLSIQYSYRF